MECIQSGMDKITRLMNEIDALHRHTLATVDAEEASRLSERISSSSTLAAAEASTIRRLLKAIDTDTNQNKKKLSPSDYRLRTAKHRSWCKKFLALMDQFERMQSNYRNKYRTHLERQYLLVKPDASRAELDELHGAHSTQIMSQEVSKDKTYCSFIYGRFSKWQTRLRHKRL